MRRLHVVAASIVLAACSLAMASEEPHYKAVHANEAADLRRHGTYPLAEAVVSAAPKAVGNNVFRRLARYVLGKDKGALRSAMTAPSVQAGTGIETTADSDYENKSIAPQARVWYCGYETISITIRCVLGETGSGAPEPVQLVDPRLPVLVDNILNSPQTIDGVVVIPLFSIPMEFAMAGELAESIMCGSSTLCGIVFAKSKDELAARLDQRAVDRAVAAIASNQIATAAIESAETLQR